MFNILQSTQLSSNTFDFWLEAPRIATHAQAGQFVILRIDEKGERIPLTIAETNPQAGSIRIIFQVIGKTTAALSQLKTSDSLLDITGPLGMPTEVKQYGTVMGCRWRGWYRGYLSNYQGFKRSRQPSDYDFGSTNS